MHSYAYPTHTWFCWNIGNSFELYGLQTSINTSLSKVHGRNIFCLPSTEARVVMAHIPATFRG